MQNKSKVFHFSRKKMCPNITYIHIVAIISRGARANNVWVLHRVRTWFTFGHHWKTE
jgi:hypothetical protein